MNYQINDLVKVAMRQNNKKRSYLLVNPLQGKHIAANPHEVLQLFTCLADKVASTASPMDKVLIIGFAETATAIASCVAIQQTVPTYYLQTTREDIPGAQYLYFSEVHSHVTEQKLVKNDLSRIWSEITQVIFIDDEVTTGNTILNLIEVLNNEGYATGSKTLTIASLLNGMTAEIVDNFGQANINLVYLLKSDNAKLSQQLHSIELTPGAIRALNTQYDLADVTKYRVSNYRNARKLLAASDYECSCQALATNVLASLGDLDDEHILVLGTEELMYPALCAAARLSSQFPSATVKFHATTRSPIVPSVAPGYPITAQYCLNSLYDTKRNTYIYNLAKYDKVIIITDAAVENEIDSLVAALNYTGNKHIHIFYWGELMRSSYQESDVKILLKDITGMVQPLSTTEREQLIQQGRHYSEMLPVEYKPSKVYMQAYYAAMEAFAKDTAYAVGNTAEKIYKRKNKKIVLVSLARAGLPIGILIKHYLQEKYAIAVEHYAISIIRGRGIDKNAINYILERHAAEDIQFVDGWIGKGAILATLSEALRDYASISPELAVLADPANVTDLCGTHEDILIPSSCLNSTISGLISRTVLTDTVIGPNDFHGAAYYAELQSEDISYEFINCIKAHFDFSLTGDIKVSVGDGMEEVLKIKQEFAIDDINFIKPSIGEATRVLLRRVPWKILINEKDKDSLALRHLLRLAEEKGVPVEYYPLRNYKACGIIKKYTDI